MVGDCSSICIAHILNFTVKKDPSDTIIKYAKQILQEEAKHATITLAREYGKHLIRLLREKLLKKKKKEKNEAISGFLLLIHMKAVVLAASNQCKRVFFTGHTIFPPENMIFKKHLKKSNSKCNMVTKRTNGRLQQIFNLVI